MRRMPITSHFAATSSVTSPWAPPRPLPTAPVCVLWLKWETRRRQFGPEQNPRPEHESANHNVAPCVSGRDRRHWALSVAVWFTSLASPTAAQTAASIGVGAFLVEYDG